MNSIMNENSRAVRFKQYKDMGVSVFPLQPRTKLPYKNKGWKKYQTRFITDREIIEEVQPDSNIACVLGEISGHLVDLDFDFRDEEQYINPLKVKMYNDFIEKNPIFKTDVTVIKSDNGFHHLFKVEDSYLFKNKDFFMNALIMGQVKSNHGYCLLPPSIHPYGSEYTFQNFVEFNKLPVIDILSIGLDIKVNHDYISRLNPSKTKKIQTLSPELVYRTKSKYITNAVNNTKMRILQAGEGYRNTTINSEIYSLARLIPTSELTEETIISELYDVALSLYDEDRTSDRQDIRNLMNVFNSAIEAGMKNPKELPRKR